VAAINGPAAYVGVTVLQAATPESIEAVVDKWMDNHASTEVLSIDLQVTGQHGPLYVLIVYKRPQRVRRT
jgi:hypothetical protein